MGTLRPITVLIAACHELMRRGLEAVLSERPDLLLAEAAGGCAAALEACVRLGPDVLLLEVAPPGLAAAATIRQIRRRSPCTQVVALADAHDDALLRELLSAGALSYLLQSADAGALALAIRRAADGQPTLADEATQALIHAAQHPTIGPHDLTQREREVLALLVHGLSNPQIARRLMLSRSTVKFHVSAILARLGAASRTEAVALALQHHVVESHI